MPTTLTMQYALIRLTEYWAGQGCAIVQPMNTEVGAGTRHQHGGVRTLIDLPEINHRHAGKRQVRSWRGSVGQSGSPSAATTAGMGNEHDAIGRRSSEGKRLGFRPITGREVRPAPVQ